MPKKFTETEKEYISKRLKEEAITCMSTYGIRKTTVDELVKRVNIPKGTFYLFYVSKELLFFDVITDLNKEIQGHLLQKITELKDNVTVDWLTDVIFDLYQQVNRTGLLHVLVNGELDYLMRKLPEEAVKQHMDMDDSSMKQLFAFIPGADEKDIEVFSGALRGVFLTMLYRREIGNEIYDEALRIMIRGIVLQILSD